MSDSPSASCNSNLERRARALRLIAAVNRARLGAVLQQRHAANTASGVPSQQATEPANVHHPGAIPAKCPTTESTVSIIRPYNTLTQARFVTLVREIRNNWKFFGQSNPQGINNAASQPVLSLSRKDVSINILRGLYTLSAMTRGQGAAAQKLLLDIMKARTRVTGESSGLQARDIVVAIRLIQQRAAVNRATPGRQQAQQMLGTLAAVPIPGAATTGGVPRQPAVGQTAMVLTFPSRASWGEQAMSIRNLYLMIQRRAILARRQSVKVTMMSL